MLIQKFFLFLLLSAISISAIANSSVDASTLQSYADEYLKAHHGDEHISAVSITLQKANQASPLSVYAGSISYDNHAAISANNLFQIGSITKSFISVLILQLESDPSLHFNINDRLDKFLPQYKHWQSITIKQLLNMTSGITDYIESQEFITDLIANPYRERTANELIQYSYQLKTLFAPGTHYNYSNANYILLGMIIEKITGHSLADEMKTRLFKPLKLQHTFYLSENLDEQTDSNLVSGYQYKKITQDFIPMGTETTDFSLSFFGAAGGIIATADDLTEWVKDLFTPGKVLNSRQLEELTNIVSMKDGRNLKSPSSADPNGYGLGIIYSYFPEINELAYAYEGITFGGRAVYLYIPKRELIITAMVNSSVDGSEDNPDHLKNLLMKVYQLTNSDKIEA